MFVEMRAHIFFILSFIPLIMFSQKLKITTEEGQIFEVALLSDSERHQLIGEKDGQVDKGMRYPRTARTYKLRDGRIVIEFFDGQGALTTQADLARLRDVRFFKTHIDFLKRNITYRIDLSYEKGKQLALTGKRLEQFKSATPGSNDFALYELPAGQVLYINHSPRDTTAIILENLKGAASLNENVLMETYGDLETASAKFIAGDPMWDYNPQQFWVYPADEQKVIKNHQLKLLERKIYVNVFHSNLYQSERGYYVLLTEFNQKDMRGVQGLGIGEGRVYQSLGDVKADQQEYERKKASSGKSEHFYRKISDQYGREFPSKVSMMIDSMCAALNIDRKILTYDSAGMALVDAAIHWNHDRYWLFNRWYPGVLAFYGECYMRVKGDGRWVVQQEKSSDDHEEDVLIPHLVLADGDDAFDSNDFYKSMLEWPIALQEAGDWDGTWRAYKRRQEEQ